MRKRLEIPGYINILSPHTRVHEKSAPQAHRKYLKVLLLLNSVKFSLTAEVTDSSGQRFLCDMDAGK